MSIRIAFLMMMSGLLFPLNLSFDRTLPVHEANKRDPVLEASRDALRHRGAPADQIETLSKAVTNACRVSNYPISPALIVSLMDTESGFRKDAVSPKGYRGLLQTPWATAKWPDVDILLGVRILEEKLRIANNHLPLALALYKGGDNRSAHRRAGETLRIYQDLLKVIEKKSRLEEDRLRREMTALI